eukprot:15145007-Alexandrium_andersonii.AAC.1
MIDYGVFSESMLGFVREFTVDLEAPWAPHAGLALVVKGRPQQVRIATLVAPRRFRPQWVQTTTEKGGLRTERKAAPDRSLAESTCST